VLQQEKLHNYNPQVEIKKKLKSKNVKGNNNEKRQQWLTETAGKREVTFWKTLTTKN
jgi:hypothetical protein